MQKAVALIPILALLALAACSGSDSNPITPPTGTTFRVLPNTALYGEADYDGMLLAVEEDCDFKEVPNAALYGEADYEGLLLRVESNMTAEACKDSCRADPECTFFYHNARGNLVLEPLTTQQNDCAFFRGKLWAGSAPQSDTYVKQDAVETAKQMCLDNPQCTFFSYNERGRLVLAPLTTEQYDAAFFRGKLWPGSAPQTDTYVKNINGVDAWDL